MSVPNWRRGVNLLAIEVKAIELLSYSIKATMQQKNFRLRHHYELGAPIVDLARNIMHNTILADKTIPDTPEMIQKRRNHLLDALQNSELLRKEINMNLWDFNLQSDSAKYWDSLIDGWRESCFAWLRADKKKYGD